MPRKKQSKTKPISKMVNEKYDRCEKRTKSLMIVARETALIETLIEAKIDQLAYSIREWSDSIHEKLDQIISNNNRNRSTK